MPVPTSHEHYLAAPPLPVSDPVTLVHLISNSNDRPEEMFARLCFVGSMPSDPEDGECP